MNSLLVKNTVVLSYPECSSIAIDIVETSHSDALWHIRLPENIQQDLNSKRSRYEVTLDRQLAAAVRYHMLDLDSFLMQYLLEKAKAYDFMG